MRFPRTAAVVLLLLVAGSVTLTIFRAHAGGGRAGRADTRLAAAAVRALAAEWISRQITRSAIVACDPLMCSALETHGEPAANLLVLGTADPLGAVVVVVTPVVRSEFGSRLDNVYAPSVIAGFGSGSSRVDVRVVAPHGAAAYLAALRQDVAARKAAGIQLLGNERIEVTAQARMQLAAGEVDSRLLIMLPALAAAHRVQIFAFRDPGPGASAGIPWCSVDLSGSGRAVGMTDASYLRWLVGFLRAQLAPFAASTAILRQGDQSIVRVDFSRPSPLGLLRNG